MIFKNWNDVDERCEHCNNVTKKAKGINKQNMKRLVSLRFSFDDLLILFILLLVCLTAYAYTLDIAKCREAYAREDFQSCLANVSQRANFPEYNELCRAGFEDFCTSFDRNFDINFTLEDVIT